MAKYEETRLLLQKKKWQYSVEHHPTKELPN